MVADESSSGDSQGHSGSALEVAKAPWSRTHLIQPRQLASDDSVFGEPTTTRPLLQHRIVTKFQ